MKYFFLRAPLTWYEFVKWLVNENVFLHIMNWKPCPHKSWSLCCYFSAPAAAISAIKDDFPFFIFLNVFLQACLHFVNDLLVYMLVNVWLNNVPYDTSHIYMINVVWWEKWTYDGSLNSLSFIIQAVILVNQLFALIVRSPSNYPHSSR